MKFVLVVVGQEFVQEVNLCLRFLKKYVKNDIVVVSSRATGIDHDNIEEVVVDSSLNNFQANRFLKTMVHRIVPGLCCYMDNDVLAVSEDASKIFDHFRGPITFATDHVVTFDYFSPWALKKGRLPEVAKSVYGLDIDPKWSLWNGGVFLFNEESTEFLDWWNEATMHVFFDDNWIDRDQASLAIAAWKFGLQDHPRLPQQFNWLVQHSGIPFGELSTKFEKGRFSFQDKQIHMMHFIATDRESDQSEYKLALSLME